MKIALLSGVALVALMSSAFAADLPRRPVPAAAPVYMPVAYNWTGFYVGINGGGGWGTGSINPIDLNPSGGVFGGQAGYNWQSGQFVWGAEADIQWSGLEDSGPCRGGRTCEISNDWFGTVRGRVGYAGWDRTMIYATGGFAYGNVEASVTGRQGISNTGTGWTVGGGVEYAIPNNWWGFGGNWTARVEYLFVDLGDFNCGLRDCGRRQTNVDFQANIVRAALNYRF
jgi:outer membrane immunogenic protein